MAHHSDEEPLSEAMKQLMGMKSENSHELGATGRFPQGKVAPHDEGELRLGVANDKGKVFVDFGKPIRSLGMDPEQANELADLLKRHADAAWEYTVHGRIAKLESDDAD